MAITFMWRLYYIACATYSLPNDDNYAEEEVNERAKRAAAAARKWREYSRKRADKPPKFKLPEAASTKDKWPVFTLYFL